MIPIDISVEIWYNKCGQKIVHIVSTKAQMKQNIHFSKDLRGLFRYPPRVKRAFGAGNNPMVGMTVAVAVAVEEAFK